MEESMQPEKFRTFEQAVNIIEEKKREDKRKKAKKKDMPISAPDPEGMQRFLDYATSLLKKGYPELVTLLRLRYKFGYSHKRIAKELGGGASPKMVKELERTAIKRCQDEITKRRGRDIPVIGG